MRVVGVSKHDDKVLEVRWMWLPTFIGQNSHLLQMLDKAVTEEFPPPYESTDEKLDEINKFVIDWLSRTLRISGLREYLQAIENVDDERRSGLPEREMGEA